MNTLGDVFLLTLRRAERVKDQRMRPADHLKAIEMLLDRGLR